MVDHYRLKLPTVSMTTVQSVVLEFLPGSWKLGRSECCRSPYGHLDVRASAFLFGWVSAEVLAGLVCPPSRVHGGDQSVGSRTGLRRRTSI